MQVFKTRTGREYFVIGGVVYMVGTYTGVVHKSCLDAVDFPQAIIDGALKFSRVMSVDEYLMRVNEASWLNSTNS